MDRQQHMPELHEHAPRHAAFAGHDMIPQRAHRCVTGLHVPRQSRERSPPKRDVWVTPPQSVSSSHVIDAQSQDFMPWQ